MIDRSLFTQLCGGAGLLSKWRIANDDAVEYLGEEPTRHGDRLEEIAAIPRLLAWFDALSRTVSILF